MTDAIGSAVLDNFKPPVSESAKDTSELGQDEFMTLMLTQLKYQDPFKPLENGEFIAQMAQFSTVAGIEGMNDSLETFIGDQSVTQTMQAADLLGKTIVTDGSKTILEQDGEVQGQFNLPEGSKDVVARFSNPFGEVVHTIELGSLGTGVHALNWDGVNQAGEMVDPGEYIIEVEYENSEGTNAIAETSLATTVESVNFGVGMARPTLSTSDGRELSISDIKKLL